jgi:colanic acid biosynthesis glycosyl transferase WcaI
MFSRSVPISCSSRTIDAQANTEMPSLTRAPKPRSQPTYSGGTRWPRCLMNVLCLNQFFWPDLAPTSQLLTDLTRALVRQGHQVTVICGRSVYADSDNSEKPRGVQIIRLPQLRFSRGILGRTSSYASFFILALWYALRTSRPQIVISMTTPPLISAIGTLVKKLRGARHFIWEMDMYPEIAVDLGCIRPNSLLAGILSALADAQRRLADGVIALGECMKDRLVARGLEPHHIHVVDNWADGSLFYPRPGAPKTQISIIYPGNFGLGHDENTFLDALPSLEHDGRFRFTFIGGGSRYAHLKSFCRAHNLQSVVFKPYCAVSELASKELPAFHVGLVLQDSRCSGSIVPSKLYPMLAAGLPVLFIGPGSATPARVINRFGCGWHIQCGDVGGLVELLKRLAGSPAVIENAGVRARQTFTERYDIEIGVGRILSILDLENHSYSSNGSSTKATGAYAAAASHR